MVMALIIVMARLLGKAFECSFSALGTIKMSVFLNFPLVRIRTFPATELVSERPPWLHLCRQISDVFAQKMPLGGR